MKPRVVTETPPSRGIRLEIPSDKLLALINDGHIHAEDIHCLDLESKRCVWRHCLDCCRRGLRNGRRYPETPSGPKRR